MAGGGQGIGGIGMRFQQRPQQGVRQAGSNQDEKGAVGIHGPDSIAAPEGAAM